MENSTEREILAILQKARNPDGTPFDIEKLNGGPKGLKELIEEVRTGEAVLKLNLQNQLIRYSARILLFISYEDYWLLEGDRIYPGNKRRRKRMFGQAASETPRAGESQLDAALRGFKEEFGLNVPRDKVRLSHRGAETYPSSVYEGIWSATIFTNAHVKLTDLEYSSRPWIEGPELNDGEAKVKTHWLHAPYFSPVVKTFEEDLRRTYPPEIDGAFMAHLIQGKK